MVWTVTHGGSSFVAIDDGQLVEVEAEDLQRLLEMVQERDGGPGFTVDIAPTINSPSLTKLLADAYRGRVPRSEAIEKVGDASDNPLTRTDVETLLTWKHLSLAAPGGVDG